MQAIRTLDDYLLPYVCNTVQRRCCIPQAHKRGSMSVTNLTQCSVLNITDSTELHAEYVITEHVVLRLSCFD
jgi:hypothetical protein